MTVQEEVKEYIAALAEPKSSEIAALHRLTLQTLPGCRLWYFDGKDSNNKTVANPTIGYGFQIMKYADGTTKEYFQIGVSANKTGISVYILGLKDKTYLARTFGDTIGKAGITGYCIKFKKLQDIDLDVLAAAIRAGGAGVE